jgi:hypothetical protein
VSSLFMGGNVNDLILLEVSAAGEAFLVLHWSLGSAGDTSTSWRGSVGGGTCAWKTF